MSLGLLQRYSSRALLLGIALLMVVGTASGVSVYNNEGGVAMQLGEQLRSYVVVHNPTDEEDTVTLSASPSMPSGTFTANIITEGRHTDNARIKVGPGSNRTVPVLYTASLCTTQPSCLGDVTYNARSLETGDTDSITVPVNITHRQEVYGSPGITGLQLIVIAVLGATAVVLGQKGRRSRRSSDRPDT